MRGRHGFGGREIRIVIIDLRKAFDRDEDRMLFKALAEQGVDESQCL